jgi:hypothetical protein
MSSLLLLAALAWASPEKEASALLEKARLLLESQANKPADEIRALDRKIMALGPEAAKLGWRAVPVFSKAALDRGAPPKLRLFALSYLALLREPAALPAFTAVLTDASAPAFLRESAAESLANLPISAAARRKSLCLSLDVKRALAEAASLGCDEVAPLKEPAEKGDLHALSALGRTLPLEAVRLMLELLPRFRADSEQRVLLIRALAKRPSEIRLLGPESARPVWSALRDSGRSPDVAVAALPLLAELRPEGTVELLLRMLDDNDAGVAVSAAEALVKLKAEPARTRLDAMLAGALNDPRFGPRKDAAALLERLEKAAAALKKSY